MAPPTGTELEGIRVIGNRTFWTAVFAQVASTIALFTGHLTGDQWVFVTPTLLAIYGGKSVAESYVQKKA